MEIENKRDSHQNRLHGVERYSLRLIDYEENYSEAIKLLRWVLNIQVIKLFLKSKKEPTFILQKDYSNVRIIFV